MAILETISGVAGAASAVAKLGSAFGIGGGKRTSGGIAREQLRMQNRAIKERPDSIRKGAERGGFNPLTYMMASGGGANVGSFDTGATPSAPKLASVGAALQDVGDFFQRQQTIRQNEERLRSSVEADLAYIEAERKAAGGVGSVIQTTLRAPRMQQTVSPQSVSADTPSLYGDREYEKSPASNMPGAFDIQNSITDKLNAGKPVTVMGDEGDAADVSQLLGIGVQAIPQMVWNTGTKWGGKIGNAIDDWRYKNQFDRLHNKQEVSEGRQDLDKMRSQPYSGWMDDKLGTTHAK